jgi:hypothetical protein
LPVCDRGQPVRDDDLHVRAALAALAHARERRVVEPPSEIRTQQELAVRAHARREPHEPVLLGPLGG